MIDVARRDVVADGRPAAGTHMASRHNDGMRAATQSVEGEEALMALAPGGHFYLRADPGPEIATLEATREGELKLSRMAPSPQAGHCLTNLGHCWTCDESGGRLLGYVDP